MRFIKYNSLIVLSFFLANLSYACTENNESNAVNAMGNPQEIVQQATDNLLNTIKQNKQDYKTNPKCFYEAVESILGPITDFDTFSARVMGKYFKQASTEQHQKFIETMRKTALESYAQTLLDNEGFNVNVLPLKKPIKETTTKTKVEMEVISESGEKYPLSYSMTRKDDKGWVVANVIVNGINLGLTYRNQFAQAMQSNGNDIDKVIANWTSDVETE